MIHTHHTRRNFLKTAGALALSSLSIPSWAIRKADPLLAFSTLGCPDWSLNTIADFAHEHGYKGIEVRGLMRQMDLTQCDVFSQQHIASSKRMLHDRGLKFVNLGASTNMHQREGSERRKQIDVGKRYIDLAQALECPYIRVFPNNFPKDQKKEETLDLIVKGLLELATHAKDSSVTVLMETHGDVLYTDDVLYIMKAADHKKTGLVWDFTNMWVKTKESPAVMYKKLKPYIHHTHIKNARLSGEKITYTRITQGEVPIFEAIDLLYKNGYKGYYSFEWEKYWHPELEEPELPLADYAVALKRYFSQK